MRHLRLASVAIALLSGSIIMFELALIRIFSFILWHHFAFMVISVALLGFGVSGVVLYLWPRLGEPTHQRASLYSGLFALTGPACVIAMVHVPLDFTELVEDSRQLIYLLVDYAILVVPFTFAGLGVAVLLKGYAAEVGRVYGCDLLGAALGCFAVVAGTSWLGMEGMVSMAAAAAAAAAALLSLPTRGGGPKRATWGWGIVGLLATMLALPASDLWRVPAGKGKSLEKALRTSTYPDSHHTFSHWNALFRTDVVENSFHTSWTVNPAAPLPPPRQHQIVIDGDASTPLVHLEAPTAASLSFLDYTISSLGPQVFRPEKVLVIGSGGGVDVQTALYHGARQVDAVEINADIARLVTTRYGPWLGHLFEREEVTLHIAEGRSFVRHTTDAFDLIQLSLVDTWAASAAGALSLVESYLYTVEAFEDYLTHLSEDGVLTVSRWLRAPPRETLRLVTVATAALERLGVERPEDHIVVCTLGGNVGNVLVKRTPFVAGELAAVRRVASARGFDVAYAPDTEGDDTFFSSYLRSQRQADFLAAYPFDVRPVVDDRPFFFQFSRWRDALSQLSGERAPILTGKLILIAVLLQGLVFSLALLVAPMVLVRRASHGPSGVALRAVAYFVVIGIAFMLFEITLMQRFTLYLGHPVYGVALVLAVLLLGAGAGSLTSSRTAPLGRAPERAFLLIVALGVVYALALPWVFAASLGAPLIARCVIGVVLTFPMGFALGVPFPAAMTRLEGAAGARLVAWGWAANACGSVLGPLLAMMLAIDLGYLQVTLVAAALYGVAYLTFGKSLWLGKPAP